MRLAMKGGASSCDRSSIKVGKGFARKIISEIIKTMSYVGKTTSDVEKIISDLFSPFAKH